MMATKVKPNTIVMYQGGGYDGCFWEWNYAYYDKDGKFHCVAASGYAGCNTEEELAKVLDDNDTDLYELNEDGETARFGREAPISHLLGVAKWFGDNNIDVTLTVVCDECGDTVDVKACEGEGIHGIGGIATEHDKIVCEDCHGSGSCAYCGEYVGMDEITEESGYCEWCHKDHWKE